MAIRELMLERENSKLNLEELTNLLDGGKEFTEKRRMMLKLILDDPVFCKDDHYFLTVDEAFDDALKKSVHMVPQFSQMTSPTVKRLFGTLTNVDMPFTLHELMFIPAINKQGTDEQRAKWLQLARNYNIIGAYAQTELGHGTFIRGLETTATYDPSTEEFILNSPTLTSTKWWCGGLGIIATHAIVVARLITKGKDHGIHLFIVQLRNLEDHQPLPGVQVGDIGPKFGYFAIDNGFLRLTNVRIPRDQMLMKYAQVSPDGTYSKPPTDKITYGAMIIMRVGIVFDSYFALAKAVTIATRYSVVRRQTQNRPGQPETQVLDYQTQQFKLLPLLASAYALCFTSHFMNKMYSEVMEAIAEGNLDSLPDLHATSAGLKAFCTELSSQGIELCRLCCGGHGYSLASGIPHLYVNAAAYPTYEGDNTVLSLQTARYLHKVVQQKLPQSQLPNNVCYLASDYPKYMESVVHTPKQFSDPHVLLEAYRQRAKRLVEVASSHYQDNMRRGMDSIGSWDGSSVDWTIAARAHCHYIVLKSFYSSIETADLCDVNLSILHVLCNMYGVFGIVQYSGEFCLDGYMSSEQVGMAKTQLYYLLKEVRQEAIPLVDAFDIPDDVLNSALGRYDGDVYKHLYEWALKAPRNKTEVHETYQKYLRPLIKKTKAKL